MSSPHTAHKKNDQSVDPVPDVQSEVSIEVSEEAKSTIRTALEEYETSLNDLSPRIDIFSELEELISKREVVGPKEDDVHTCQVQGWLENARATWDGLQGVLIAARDSFGTPGPSFLGSLNHALGLESDVTELLNLWCPGSSAYC